MSSSSSDQTPYPNYNSIVWLYEEIESVLTQTQKTLKSHLRVLAGERKATPEQEQAALNDLKKRIKQNAIAFEIAGAPIAKKILDGLSSALDYIALHPNQLSEQDESKIKAVCFALLDYLQQLLKGNTVYPLALFYQYNDLLSVFKEDAFPADLWDYEMQLKEVSLPPSTLQAEALKDIESRLDNFMLLLLRGNLEAATDFKDIAHDLALKTERVNEKEFWSLTAGFFEGLSKEKIAFNVFTKRIASQILQIHKAYLKQSLKLPEKFAKNLLFFCLNLKADIQLDDAPILAAIRQVYGKERFKWLDYTQKYYGRIEPDVLSAIKDKISKAKASWSSYTSGEPIQGQLVIDSIKGMAENLKQILPESGQFTESLVRVVSELMKEGAQISPEHSLEVATAILYVEVLFTHLDLSDGKTQERFSRLAERLESLQTQNKAMPLDSWIEDLYRQVSDDEAMENIVTELQAMLNKVEQNLDTYLRKEANPKFVSDAISGMDGILRILNILELAQVAQAASMMKSQMQWLLDHHHDASEENVTERENQVSALSNSIGAFGFLVNLLSQQYDLIEKLFVFDEEKQELSLLMGRDPYIADTELLPTEFYVEAEDEIPTITPIELGMESILDESDLYTTSEEDRQSTDEVIADTLVADKLSELEDDFADDLQEIFLEEAHEVIELAFSDFALLQKQLSHREALTAVRRGFHTLKGSARMVGLIDYGEAAWIVEQRLNDWLTTDAPASQNLLDFISFSLDTLKVWATELQSQQSTLTYSLADFSARADELQLTENEFATTLIAEMQPFQSAESAEEEPEEQTMVLESSEEDETLDKAAVLAPLFEQELSLIDLSLPGSIDDLPEVGEDIVSEAEQEDAGDTLIKGFALAESLDADTENDAEPSLEEIVALEEDKEPELSDLLLLEEETEAFEMAFADTSDEEVTSQTEEEALTPAVIAEEDGAAIDTAFQEDILIDTEDILLDDEEPLELESEVIEIEDDVLRIGEISVDKMLFSIFLDEAEQRKLKLEESLILWQSSGALPALADAQILAHAISGSASTVGFASLARFAKSLEHAIEHFTDSFTQQMIPSDRSSTLLFWYACEEIIRLLVALENNQILEPVAELEQELHDFLSLEFIPDAEEDDIYALQAEEAAEEPVDQSATAPEPLPTIQVDDLDIDEPALAAEHWDFLLSEETTLHTPAFLGLDEQDCVSVTSDLFSVFSEEAQELLPEINEGVREWIAQPNHLEALVPVQRALHTLKGSARLAGAMRLGRFAHELETSLTTTTPSLLAEENVASAIMLQLDSINNEADLLEQAHAEYTEGLFSLEDLLKTAPQKDEAKIQEEGGKEPSVDRSKRTFADEKLAIHQLNEADQNAVASDLFYIFKDEATLLLSNISQTLRKWVVSLEPVDRAILRDLHTLKGAARLTGAMRLGGMVHELESTLQQLNEQKADQVPEEQLASIEQQFSKIELEFDLLCRAADEYKDGSATHHLAEQDALAWDETLDVADRPIIGGELFLPFSKEAQKLLDNISEKLLKSAQRFDADDELLIILKSVQILQDNTRLIGLNRFLHLLKKMDVAVRSMIGTPYQQEQVEDAIKCFSHLQAELDLLVAADHQFRIEQSISTYTLSDELLESPQETTSEQLQQREKLNPRVVNPNRTRAVSSKNADQLIRIRAGLIDELVVKAGEVNVFRSQLTTQTRSLKDLLSSELTSNLERLRTQLRDLEIQAETQMVARLDATRAEGLDFDPLEFDRYTRIQELTRIMAESVNDIGTVQKSLMQGSINLEDSLAAQSKSAKDIQHLLLRARMVSFSSISERFHRVVRLSAIESNKKAKLVIEGEDIEIDRAILDHVAPAFEHILRNSVVHGIELPEQRRELGKPEVGEIKLTLLQDGNDVKINLTDDGAGLNLTKIREKSENAGWVEKGAELSDYDLAQLIFKSGLTTVDEVSELAGRGVGLDMAYSEIAVQGGRLEVLSEADRGTEFKINLPLTTAVTQVVLVKAEGKIYGLPVNLIESVQRFSADVIAEAVNTGMINHNDENLPAYWLGGLLEHSREKMELQNSRLQWLVINGSGQKVILTVDQVLGSQEVVIKNVGPQFAHLAGFAGLTVLANGQTVLIYNPLVLVRLFAKEGDLQKLLEVGAIETEEGFATSVYSPEYVPQAIPRTNKVMVVDDSLTVRRITKRFLERSGFEVILAKDGQDALRSLNNELPALILSDIEMPQMDGFEFVRQLRSRRVTEDLPVIMITSRIAQKHSDYAKELGVKHYLGKPYDEKELLELVNQYVKR